MTRLRVISLCMACLAFLTACGTTPKAGEPELSPAVDASSTTPVAAPITAVPTSSEGQQPVVELIPTLPSEVLATVEMAPIFTADLLSALGAELQLSPQDIRLLSFEAVDWPNSCLGVERKGVMCLDVITPGYLFVFEISNGVYEAHTNADGSYYLFVLQTKLSTTPP